MALDIKSDQGVVQVVMTVEMLDAFLRVFPAFTVFPMPAKEDDLHTYGISLKDLPPAPENPSV